MRRSKGSTSGFGSNRSTTASFASLPRSRRTIWSRPASCRIVPLLDLDVLGTGSVKLIARDFTRLPLNVDGESAPRPETGHRAGGPSFGERREEFHFPRSTLHEHLGNGCHAPKVGVDLKWRAGVQEVRVSASASIVSDGGVGYRMEQGLQEFPAAVALMQPCPKAGSPRIRPTYAAVATAFERDSCRSGQIRRAVETDLVGWVQGV